MSLAICDTIQTNVDYGGNDLNAGGSSGRVKGNMATVEQCRQACVDLPTCAGFTFVKTTTSGDNCAVKHTWVETSKSSSTCCDSARVTSACRAGIKSLPYILC